VNKNISIDVPARAFETITVGALAAVTLTVATATGKQGCFLSVETADVRFRTDGTAPTTTVGHLLYATGSMRLMHPTLLTNLKMITTAGTATVHVSYY
jgi:hypothetical protein